MRGKDNSNYIKSRDISESLCKIIGLSRNVTHSFMRIVSNALIHKVTEEVLEADNKLSKVDIEIPFIGLLTVSNLDSKDNITATIVLEDEFKSDLHKAVNNGESPLLKLSEERFVSLINSRYNSLL